MEDLVNRGDPENEEFTKGPKAGETVPVFSLPDQQGHLITYRPDGRHKALILFHRSAAW